MESGQSAPGRPPPRHAGGPPGRRPDGSGRQGRPPSLYDQRGGAQAGAHPARSPPRASLPGGDGAGCPDAAAGTAAPLTLTGVRQEDALAAAAALAGRSGLGTAAPTLTAAEILRLAKQRAVPEKRFALLKGPLAVRPLFVHKQERVLGLVWATMAALLLFALLALQAPRAGLSAAARTLLAQAAPLAVLLLPLPDGTTLPRLANLGPPVTELLRRLGWPAAACYC